MCERTRNNEWTNCSPTSLGSTLLWASTECPYILKWPKEPILHAVRKKDINPLHFIRYPVVLRKSWKGKLLNPPAAYTTDGKFLLKSYQVLPLPQECFLMPFKKTGGDDLSWLVFLLRQKEFRSEPFHRALCNCFRKVAAASGGLAWLSRNLFAYWNSKNGFEKSSGE